jgi:hypothetical protein
MSRYPGWPKALSPVQLARLGNRILVYRTPLSPRRGSALRTMCYTIAPLSQSSICSGFNSAGIRL